MPNQEQVRKAILSHLRNNPSGLTQAELIMRMSSEFAKPMIWSVLGPVISRMEQDKLIEQADAMRYTLTEAGKAS